MFEFMKKLNKNDCELVLDKIYEKVESGDLTPENQIKVVSLFENQNPEFTESIVDDQLSRLEKMYNDGKLSKEDYEKQKASWMARKERYRLNLNREKEEADEEKQKEEQRPINRIRKALRKNRQTHQPAIESADEFWRRSY